MDARFLINMTFVVVAVIVAKLGEARLLANVDLELDEPVRFVAIGDWGGSPRRPFTTPAQLRVARQMQLYAAGAAAGAKAKAVNQSGSDSGGLDFVLSLGDNFYNSGVRSPVDERFKLTFEDVYARERLAGVPWYVVAGNHDHRKGRAVHQLAYANRSTVWHFPDFFYTLTVRMRPRRPGAARLVVFKFYHIDTTLLCTLNDDDNNSDAWSERPARGSLDHEMYARLRGQFEADRGQVDVRIVVGHHPIVSSMGGRRRVRRCMRRSLADLLAKHRVSVYLSGHDHTLQYNLYTHERARKSKNTTTTTRRRRHTLHTFVSGAGAGVYRRPSRDNRLSEQNGTHFYWADAAESDHGGGGGGFLALTLHEKRFGFEFVDAGGVRLYDKEAAEYAPLSASPDEQED